MIAKTSRISVSTKSAMINPKIKQLLRTINEFFDVRVEEVTFNNIYSIEKPLTRQQIHEIANGPLMDPIAQESRIEEGVPDCDWTVEVAYKPGLTDNLGQAAKLTIEDFLGVKFQIGERVRSIRQYQFNGSLSFPRLKKIAEELLANPLVEEIYIFKNTDVTVEEIPIQVADTQLQTLSKDRQLALNLKEMQAIRDYYGKPEVTEEREKYQLPSNPTDIEIEAIAQTWSEHCKHKIFHANIKYSDEKGSRTINSLFKTYIKGATDFLSKEKPWLVSVFTDNAGIVRFNEKYNIAFKVETHNSPSALDPYGGALTGILGVNRDIMGAGLGARLLANTDIFCFAPPDYNKALPERILHPRRIFEGVRLGVEHGGNKCGVPTINGAIIFDERYLGKPLIYCGTVGIMPQKINGKLSHLKEIAPGDCIIIVGGKTGKDGIHGATFSSEELHTQSPAGAVQIGDPFMQKKLHDFLLDARDAGLYRAITDNGAGGLSSSVGELAILSGGCELYLDKVPLKYEGLLPWEIFLSESQERMTLAAPPENISKLQELAEIHEVEMASIGFFTSSNRLHVLFHGRTIAFLSMDFLHHGVPQLELEAEWKPQGEKALITSDHFISQDLHQMLARYNICSKESIIRQYDHEVQGGTVIKSLQGHKVDGPGDAAIILPIECSEEMEGLVIANGICPRFSDIDTYHMTANAIDEAIRNAVSVGCDPQSIAILDNFCWPDPIYDPVKTVDGKMKLAQLVRANNALHDYAIAFGTPIISGKDSMKNDYKAGSVKISVPPTVLISALGKIPDIRKAMTMDVKCPGDWVYAIGMTRNELGGSEYAQMKNMVGGIVPRVNATTACAIYQKMFEAIAQELIASCHDCSEGGLAVALIESSFAGGYGMTVDLHTVPFEGIHTDTELMFSESASRFVVTVNPDKAKDFEKIMGNTSLGRIGVVQEGTLFSVTGLHGEIIVEEDIETLKSYWQRPLKNF